MINRLAGIIVVCLYLQAASTEATLLLYDGFEYAAGGNLAGNGNWAGSSATILVNSANLDYSGLQASVGNDVTLIPGSSSGRTYASFAAQTSGTVYFSFLFQINTIPSAQRLVAYGYNSTSSSTTPYLGIFVTSSGQLAVGISTSSPQFTSSALTVGVTYLVVVAYTFGATDSAQVWINPASLGGAAPAVNGSFTASAHNSGLSYFQLNTPSAGTGGGSYELDELRIGLSWADIAPAGGSVTLAINTQPQSRSAGVGQGTAFTVGAAGDAPLRYQWYFNSSTSLTDATNATLTFSSAQRSNTGSYTVVVTNGTGAITSSIATLTVTNKSPVANADSFSRAAGTTLVIPIAALLGNDTDPDGDSVTLAGLTLLTTNGVSLTTNATAVTYPNSANVNDRFTYTIADGFGGSANGTVNITVPTVITEKLNSFLATATNTRAIFSGMPSNLYYWQRSLDMTNWAILLTTNAPSNGLFQVVDNFSGLSNPPSFVYYRVSRDSSGNNAPVAPAIVTPPQSFTVTQGLTAVFSVVASGDAPLAYQWRFNGVTQSGATNASLTLANVQTNQAGNYTVVVTNAAGAITSSVATLTVVALVAAPAITTQPVSQSVTVGNNVTFTAAASGSAPLNYQWFFNSVAQSGATNTSLALTSVATNQAGNYFVRVTNSFGAVTSAVGTLTVNAAPTGGVYYVSTTGSDANPGTFAAPFATLAKALSVMASGDTIYMRGGNYAFSAQVKPNLAGSAANYCKLWAYPGERPVMDFSGTAGGTKALYLSKDYWHVKGLEIANAQDNGIIVAGASSNIIEGCIVHDCNNDGVRLGSSSAMANYTLILNCDSYRNYQAAAHGNNGDGFSAKAGTGVGNVFRGCRSWNNSDDGWDFYDNDVTITLENCITYANGLNLWGDSAFDGNGNGFKLGGASTYSQHVLKNCLAIQNVHDGFDQNYNHGGVTLYNCTGYGNGGVTFQFPDTPTVGVDVLKNNVSYSGSIAINASAVLVSNSWQNFTVTAADFVSLDTSTVTNARNADYSLPELPLLRLAAGSQLIDKGVDVGLPYNGTAPDLGAYETGGSASSMPPAITVQPTNQTVAAGGNVMVTVSANGTAPLSYQWFFNNTAQSSATNAGLVLTGVTTNQAGNYFVRVTNSVGAVTSTVITLTVTSAVAATAPAITVQPTNQMVAAGGGVGFNVVASGTAPLSYQWFFNNAVQSSATNAAFVLSNVLTNQAGNYSVRVTNSAGAVTSAVAVLTVTQQVVTSGAFYVSPAGSDANNGDINHPFLTISKGLSTIGTDGLVYLRAGTYALSSKLNLSQTGTTNYIKLWAYPGETPVVDSTGNSSDGIGISGRRYHLKGLTVMNAGHNGINISGHSNIVENCVVHDNGNTGLHITGGQGNSVYPSYNLILNCDAYLNYDPPVGGNADGFSAKWDMGVSNVFRGCRAWWNSDDGWDFWMANAPISIEDCWAFRNGTNYWNDPQFNGNGNGFKIGGNYIPAPHRVIRSIAFQNEANGIDQNNNIAGQTLDNNTAWANKSRNYSMAHGTNTTPHTVRNNISFAGASSDSFTSDTIFGNNSWQVSPVPSTSDLQSLDASVATAPRLADGSLPVWTFLRPTANGRLVDKGVDVGLLFNGSAPDLGAFESTGSNSTIAPTITAQPASRSVAAGSNVTFSVSASGSALLSYQWFFNSVAQSSATNSSLVFAGITTNQAGNYFCVVTNSAGAATSSVATLTVTNIPPATAPGITTQPTNQTTAVGNNVSLSVVANGTAPLNYQWFFNNVAQSGATNPSLALTSVTTNSAGNYFVRITNSVGAVTSSIATLTVANSSTTNGASGLLAYEPFTNAPGTQIIGSSDGFGFSGAWQGYASSSGVATNTGYGLAYTDATGNTLVTSGGAGLFQGLTSANTSMQPIRLLSFARGTNGTDGGTTWVSFLAVRQGPTVIGANPYPRGANVDQDINSGNLQTLAIGNSSSATSNTVALIPQGALGNIKPSTTAFSDTNFIVVRLDHNSGANDNAYLFVNPNLSAEPSVAAASANSIGAFDYSFDRLRIFAGGNVSAAQPYAEIVIDEYRVGQTYADVTPFIDGSTSNPPAISAQPVSQTVAAGQGVTFSVSATGTAPLRCQWFFNNAAQSGATNASLSLAGVTTNQAGNYFVTVTNNYGAVTSTVATLTVNAPIAPSITTQPTNQTVAAGQSPALSVTATGTAPLSYQWFFNNTAQSGATNATLTLGNVQTNQTGSYFVRVTNVAGVVTSTVVTLTVTNIIAAPSITTQPASQSVTAGGSATFTVAATGTVPLSYQWYFSNAAQSGATNASLALTGVTTNQGGDYFVRVTNSVGAVTSSVATLTVTAAPTDGDLYVATTGSDANPGTLAAPFATLPKAISNAVAGKTIYVRGGTYYHSTTIRFEKSGTSGAPIRLFAYPGEQPVFNFTNQPYGAANRGFLITTNGNWWEFKGLEVCYAGDNGIKVEGSHHIFERCVLHHNGDTGIQIGFGHTDSNPGGLLAAYILVTNCDSYLNYDSDSNGGDADGFAAKMHCGQGIVFTGCRAWTNSDDGWDLFETDYGVVISNCWVWGSGVAQGNGNGFKMGGDGTGGSSMGTHSVLRGVAFGCKVNGFTQNSHKDGEVVLNSLSYSNGSSGYNYFFEGNLNSGKQNVFKNNVGIRRNPASTGNNFIEDNAPLEVNNTWNLTVTANAADYGDLSAAAAGAPRQADGSLPAGFARLVAGSDLIDKGVDTGMGFPVNGTAPDLGPYESP